MFGVSCRYIVGLAGPPGAGKSTLAFEVAYRINTLWSQKDSAIDSVVKPPDVAIVLPMDGFHLYRSQLDAMEVNAFLICIIGSNGSPAACFIWFPSIVKMLSV